MRLIIASALSLILAAPATAAVVGSSNFGGFNGPATIVEVDSMAPPLKRPFSVSPGCR